MSNNLSILLGHSPFDTPICLAENSLFQNVLITGTIGTGKTSSAMYPITKQLITASSKLGMLILDVKGNYYEEVKSYAKMANREQDLIVVDLQSNFTYNPLHKKDLKPFVLANRLKTILTLFATNNSDSFWLDKVETFLNEAIKYCRLYHNGYVTFSEIHQLVTDVNYYKTKIPIVRSLFQNSLFSRHDLYDLITCLDFFDKEVSSLDPRTLSIIQAEITRITSTFISDYDVLSTFCPNEEEISFSGFKEVLEEGKIVVLHMNIAEYRNLSKIIAAYLKLDFQTEVLLRLSQKQSITPCAFICDEYAEYVTETDANFFSQSREAKCINIVATQSYTSLLNTLKNEAAVKVILQSLVNKLWFRNDDLFTIEEAQKQIRKNR